MVADADGVPDDGETGEGDNIRVDVEAIEGGSGNDILTSGFRGHWLIGGPGDDVLGTAAAARTASRARSETTACAGPGRDRLSGDPGNDGHDGGGPTQTRSAEESGTMSSSGPRP